MSKESDFQQTALSKGEVAAPKSNPSNNTIPPAQIAQNVNLSDIFPFEFEVNESLFLLSNTAANKQKAITVISTSNWAEETEQEIFKESRGWKKVRYSIPEPQKQPLYILLKCKDCNKKLSSMGACISPEEKYETATFAKHAIENDLDFQKKVENRTTHFALHCPECYAFSISLPSENDQEEIEFGEPETKKEITTTPIYLTENQPAIQLKYFDNNGQGIKPEKAHEIDAGYDLRYFGKNTLVLQPKSLTKTNFRIVLKILPEAMIQIASRSSLASKGINIRGGVINAEYTGDITIMLQNETDKSFRIEHAKKIAQAIYLSLINISGLQSVNNREQLGKSERGMQGFGSTG
ncbi:hypothetical protein G9A89_021517 [Geosiphon pyriformis]|nr:hypothetical protein G9A89_021517 [Geosiphon pyriformis]